MSLGNYSVNVSAGAMPQKVATAFGNVFEKMVGAEYRPIAYLGSKLVNGTNHAILAEQTLVTGKDVKSIVLIVLNEKPGDVDGTKFSIVEISSLMSNGGAFGGLNIDPQTEIPAEAKAVFDKHFAGFVGANVKPFALLATQLVHGGAYVFAVESSMVVSPSLMKSGNTKSVNLVKVFADFSEIETLEVIRGKSEDEAKGNLASANNKTDYAFTWLKNSNQAGNLESPLGEWP